MLARRGHYSSSSGIRSPPDVKAADLIRYDSVSAHAVGVTSLQAKLHYGNATNKLGKEGMKGWLTNERDMSNSTNRLP
jgi:hypothetical protein